MLDEPDTYPYLWVSIQLHDNDNTNDNVLIYNPNFKGVDANKEQINYPVYIDIADLSIDYNNVVIKKAAKTEGIQHYILSVPVALENGQTIEDKEINVGADFFFSGVFGDEDISEGFLGSLCYEEGFSLGFEQSMRLEKSKEHYTVTMDLYNRFAGDGTGYDIDYYPYFWVAIGAKDDNMNNNYYILRNPFFNEANPYCLNSEKIRHGYDNQLNEKLGLND